jgi:hypothetical protein
MTTIRTLTPSLWCSIPPVGIGVAAGIYDKLSWTFDRVGGDDGAATNCLEREDGAEAASSQSLSIAHVSLFCTPLPQGYAESKLRTLPASTRPSVKEYDGRTIVPPPWRPRRIEAGEEDMNLPRRIQQEHRCISSIPPRKVPPCLVVAGRTVAAGELVPGIDFRCGVAYSSRPRSWGFPSRRSSRNLMCVVRRPGGQCCWRTRGGV